MRILFLLCAIALWLAAGLASILAGIFFGCSWLFDRLGGLTLAARANLFAAIRAFEDAD